MGALHGGRSWLSRVQAEMWEFQAGKLCGDHMEWSAFTLDPSGVIPGGNCEDSSGSWWWENWAMKEQPLQKWEQEVKTWTRYGG